MILLFLLISIICMLYNHLFANKIYDRTDTVSALIGGIVVRD